MARTAEPRTKEGSPHSLTEALQRLGAGRVEATLVAALVRRDGLGTRELVEQTQLRQPEVSVGMAKLRARGWIEAEPIARQGKGRPMHRYLLRTDRQRVRQFYEALAKKVQEQLAAALTVVRRDLA